MLTIALGINISDAHAMSSLSVSPLTYRTTLKKNTTQKGFIDVSNPGYESRIVNVSVQAFRYIDNDGTIQFYTDNQISEGVVPDLDSFKLGPRDAIRMYFVVNGKKLPSGDVYAAILFQSTSTKTSAVTQSLRVGTLLSIVNGTPSERKAEITSVNAPFIQVGTQIRATFTVKNTGNPKKSTGFYPEVTLRLWPDGREKTQSSRLVFAGLSRTTDVAYTNVGFGFHKLSVTHEGNTKSTWVFTAEPVWFAIGIILIAVSVLEYLLWLRRKGRNTKKKAKK